MNAEFLDPLDLRVTQDDGQRPRFELLRPFAYWSAVAGRDITVPVGFEFDGPSVPQALMSLSGYRGVRAACLHDWLCVSGEIDRRTADRVFLEALRVSGVSEEYAQTMYLAVSAYTEVKLAGPARSEPLGGS